MSVRSYYHVYYKEQAYEIFILSTVQITRRYILCARMIFNWSREIFDCTCKHRKEFNPHKTNLLQSSRGALFWLLLEHRSLRKFELEGLVSILWIFFNLHNSKKAKSAWLPDKGSPMFQNEKVRSADQRLEYTGMIGITICMELQFLQHMFPLDYF